MAINNVKLEKMFEMFQTYREHLLTFIKDGNAAYDVKLFIDEVLIVDLDYINSERGLTKESYSKGRNKLVEFQLFDKSNPQHKGAGEEFGLPLPMLGKVVIGNSFKYQQIGDDYEEDFHLNFVVERVKGKIGAYNCVIDIDLPSLNPKKPQENLFLNVNMKGLNYDDTTELLETLDKYFDYPDWVDNTFMFASESLREIPKINADLKDYIPDLFAGESMNKDGIWQFPLIIELCDYAHLLELSSSLGKIKSKKDYVNSFISNFSALNPETDIEFDDETNRLTYSNSYKQQMKLSSSDRATQRFEKTQQ